MLAQGLSVSPSESAMTLQVVIGVQFPSARLLETSSALGARFARSRLAEMAKLHTLATPT